MVKSSAVRARREGRGQTLLPVLASLPPPPQAAFPYTERPTSVSVLPAAATKPARAARPAPQTLIPPVPEARRPRSRCQRTPRLTGALGRGSAAGSVIRALVPLRGPRPVTSPPQATPPRSVTWEIRLQDAPGMRGDSRSTAARGQAAPTLNVPSTSPAPPRGTNPPLRGLLVPEQEPEACGWRELLKRRQSTLRALKVLSDVRPRQPSKKHRHPAQRPETCRPGSAHPLVGSCGCRGRSARRRAQEAGGAQGKGEPTSQAQPRVRLLRPGLTRASTALPPRAGHGRHWDPVVPQAVLHWFPKQNPESGTPSRRQGGVSGQGHQAAGLGSVSRQVTNHLKQSHSLAGDTRRP